MNYQKLNVYVGWFAFLVASVVYLLTIEPTASFWDCGEFIATGYKLEVGHPPGAPFFMLLTRFFSLFAFGNVEKVAMMVNSMSALASAFTILFLFWTITHLAKKIFSPNNEHPDKGQIIAILGSGLIGALAYTFSDTFWFSAVEGEVYATSSLITAVVFWAILKWENIAHEKHADRWIIFIMYIVGLSIGVHLLNLLAIPAIVLVYYFKKYTITRNGVIYSLLISLFILGTIMWGVIPGVPKVAFFFDKMFVNSFGLPFNSGTIFFVLAAAAALAFAIYYTRKNQMQVLNTIAVAFTVMMIGYSSYGVILIRSNATPPIDQNNPEDPHSLLSYLNREQYGSNPLFTGQYYNAPIDVKNPYHYKSYSWYKKDGKYVKGRRKFDYNYNEKMTTFFPRMWSSQEHHVQDYKYWAKIEGTKVKARANNGEMKTFVKPTFTENIRFFVRYQIGHMYWRYFMWNFAGRQNDIQGNGEPMNGNWISGIKFWDEARLGPQDGMPAEYQHNKAHNKYYMLPFILGIIGLVYHYRKDKRNAWIVMALFILTGLAIVVYLNQYPRQPRERDYAYAGSFYAFAIWIGLGVLGIYEALKKYMKGTPSAAIATVVTLFIPLLMGAENWDDHNRSNKSIARDFAFNYLNSVEENGVIFTNGDNDTFPLWYIQEVEGVRTDVRVICLPYLITDWYIDQMKSKYYESDPVPFSMTKEQYVTGKRDQVPIYERFEEAQELKDVVNFVASDDKRTQLPSQSGEQTDYIPTKKLKITVDSAKVMASGTVHPEDADKIVKEIRWNLGGSGYLMKNDLMILDLLANNDWERPVYFVSPGSGNSTNLRDYFQMEGFASRFVPIKTKYDFQAVGHINTDRLYDNLMNKFKWGNMGDPAVFLDYNTRRTIQIVKVRSNFGRLAMALNEEGDTQRAQEVLARGLEVLPLDKMEVDFYDGMFLEAFFACDMTDKGLEIANRIAEEMLNDMKYYAKLDQKFGKINEQSKQIAIMNIQWLGDIAGRYKQTELQNKVGTIMEDMYQLYSR